MGTEMVGISPCRTGYGGICSLQQYQVSANCRSEADEQAMCQRQDVGSANVFWEGAAFVVLHTGPDCNIQVQQNGKLYGHLS